MRSRNADLLALLNMRGAVVSIDAMGLPESHRPKRSWRHGADYVLTLKDNHPTFLRGRATCTGCDTCPCWKRWRRTTAGLKSAAMP